MGDAVADLRRARPVDALAVQALIRAAYAKWVPVIGREPKPMQADWDARVRGHRIDLLYVGGRLAALIELVPGPLPPDPLLPDPLLPDQLLIENLAVAPDAQRQGHGRRLLAHAEAVAASLGLSTLRLYTNPLFTGNVALYRRAGYGVDREDPWSGGVTVYMSKRLHP